MAINDIIYLKTSSVNSGGFVNLNATDINGSWEVFTNAENTPRTVAGSTYTTSIGDGVNTGFNNPTYTVSCVVSYSLSHVSGSTAKLDREYVEEFVNHCDEKMTLRSDVFKTTSNTNGDVTVMLTSVTFRNSNANGVSYTLSFVEVSD